ncbi:MAG: hypothetical protein UZ01_03416 [Candidatus Brocadia sinica]|uniref:hypothetical protein n=1 Tax=Candidatus Brocadia TaxID=380240 RepID=UPI000792D8D4|nr:MULTISPECIES: hypothetical protein [Brocadia]KXK25376.1 MAG: hypothetical protein UZ01_03416 [Candidatus Brocadia sinica]MCK6468541.1 hypothetical protein [Candidatus Brocadia sinica]NOG42131.1 hypothetical protein [Planctomycetota bacterium]NUO03941.1 hypothetical protein [Candidatus Brocadia sinica]
MTAGSSFSPQTFVPQRTTTVSENVSKDALKDTMLLKVAEDLIELIRTSEPLFS